MSETFLRVELFIFLITAMLALTVLARKLVIPYPILLVLGGLALAFVPGMPQLSLDPDLVFVVFLPRGGLGGPQHHSGDQLGGGGDGSPLAGWRSAAAHHHPRRRDAGRGAPCPHRADVS
jgi:hypothetical protein